MNVFDVLREKFKHKKKILIDLSNEYRDNDKRLSTGYANKALAMGDAIEIVNQVEKEFTPKTNADRIRAMSDEELAEFLQPFFSCEYECAARVDACYENCKKAIDGWLKQEES